MYQYRQIELGGGGGGGGAMLILQYCRAKATIFNKCHYKMIICYSGHIIWSLLHSISDIHCHSIRVSEFTTLQSSNGWHHAQVG